MKLSKIRGWVIYAAMGAALLGCRADDVRNGSGNTGTETSDTLTGDATDSGFGTETGTATEGGGCKGIDFLFIIDDSGSMDEEQSNLVLNFPKVVEVLNAYETPGGKKLNYRLGVTTTSVARQFSLKDSLSPTPVYPDGYAVADGLLLGQGACGLDVPWVDGPADDIADDFSCMAYVGTEGWGFEMPFAAMQLALGTQSEPGKPNFGFYRKDEESLLVVVVLTDEDDCTASNGARVGMDYIEESIGRCEEDKSTGMQPVEEVKDFLDELTGGEGHYVFIGIAGSAACEATSSRMCQSPFGDAYWAKRIEELVDLVGVYGFLGDIGSGDLWGSLEQALDVVMATCDVFEPV